MQTVGSLIQGYLTEKEMVPNQLAKKSGVSRQRLGEIIGKNRCPSEHNFQSLLEAMDPDAGLKKALIDAYQMQRKQNADRKLKTGENMREEALMKKILEHYELRIIRFFDHVPCTKGVECNLAGGLHSILNCLDENNRKHILHYQQTKEELQEYYDEVEKKSGMEMETFASTYRTRMDLFLTFVPINRDDKKKLWWKIDSIFDGLVINRSGFPFEKSSGIFPSCGWMSGTLCGKSAKVTRLQSAALLSVQQRNLKKRLSFSRHCAVSAFLKVRGRGDYHPMKSTKRSAGNLKRKLSKSLG